MLKISLLFKKYITSWVNNSNILKTKSAKFSGYCFYLNTNIQRDFQICISVPLSFHLVNSTLTFMYDLERKEILEGIAYL